MAQFLLVINKYYSYSTYLQKSQQASAGSCVEKRMGENQYWQYSFSISLALIQQST